MPVCSRHAVQVTKVGKYSRRHFIAKHNKHHRFLPCTALPDQTKVSMSVRLFYNNNNGNTDKQEIENIQGVSRERSRETRCVSVWESPTSTPDNAVVKYTVDNKISV
jgi:hypothetical protein